MCSLSDTHPNNTQACSHAGTCVKDCKRNAITLYDDYCAKKQDHNCIIGLFLQPSYCILFLI